MNYTKNQIQSILNKENLDSEAKRLIESLIIDKNLSLKSNVSSAMPDLYKSKSVNTEIKSELDKNLEAIVIDVQEHLRNNYTKAFSSIADSKEDRDVIKKLIDDYVLNNNIAISNYSSSEIIKHIQDEILNFGQLNDFIYDPDIEEIRINGSNDPVKVMKMGKQYETDIIISPQNVYIIAERMIRGSQNAKQLKKDMPFTRVRLGNNIRVTVMTDPIAREENSDGRVIQMIIRKQSLRPFKKDFLLQNTINQYGYELLNSFLKYKISTVFYGGTNSGKTGTLRSFLDSSIPNNRRGITVAEIDEMNLRKVNPITKASINEIMMWELSESLMDFRKAVNAALTCSPEMLILQEMKGEECVEVMDASITGHQTVVTMHADNIKVFAERILSMYKQSGSDVQDSIILSLIPQAFPIIVQMAKLEDGSRRIISIDEIDGYDKQKNELTSINLLKYKIDDTIYSYDEDGNELSVKEIVGHYEANNFISERIKEKMFFASMSKKAYTKLKELYDEIKK